MRLTAFHLCLPSKMHHNANGCKINASSCVQNAFIGYMGWRKTANAFTVTVLMDIELINSLSYWKFSTLGRNFLLDS